MPVWLERRDIDFFYEELMSEFGGLPGPPKEDAPAATLARPQNQLGYEPSSSLYDLAASYGFGFARNHCFPDGNKRIALAATDIFLSLNAIDLVPDEAEAVVIVNALASGEYSQEDLAEWLENNSTGLDAGDN
ncbi:MAG TPA: type II toxin-antitoxin system death-on-curing family toxin [Hyphomicrobiales bacterium]|nr:type II toxin-antitoxin system death-on-curing family toxin [Hyphomicrobiales bacterium]